MSEEISGKRDEEAPQADLGDIHPAARVALQTLALPVAGLIAAGVLLVVGISLVLVALVLVLALVAGVASVPLAVMAGRRRRNPALRGGRKVLDARATVRKMEPARAEEKDGESDASRR